MKGNPSINCPVDPAIDLIGGRWITPILWTLSVKGRMRFTDLQKQLVGITPKVLTERLRQLESDGLITRTYYSEMPPRVEYESTELAASLWPVFTSLIEWGEANFERVQAARLAHRKTRPAAASLGSTRLKPRTQR